VEYYQIPYGVIDAPSTAEGTGIGDASYGTSTIAAANASGYDAAFTENKFLTHFNENYGVISADVTYPINFNPLITLPPAFRTYYSKHTEPNNLERTVNAMQSKEYLITKHNWDIDNPIATEYSHVSNILEWSQAGEKINQRNVLGSGNSQWSLALVIPSNLGPIHGG